MEKELRATFASSIPEQSGFCSNGIEGFPSRQQLPTAQLMLVSFLHDVTL